MRITSLIICLFVIATAPICVQARAIDEVHGRLLKDSLSPWERAGVKGEASNTRKESFSLLPHLSDPDRKSVV